ncbi:MAG: hypothetical protein H6741_28545 [Alphaproteobacteria bacterium]|nr:hypothetical protein [Alphaproteobacteria bacterium]MCB9796667.1 hypothetical protein [Alphaproteobacteria bacterium]
MTGDPHKPAAPRTALLYLLLFLPFAALTDRLWTVCDDAFISFRYARNLVEGLGLVYNPGEAVEGYSNFLWVLLSAGLYGGGLELTLFTPLISAACGALLLWRVLRCGVEDLGLPPHAALAGAATLALSPAFACWSTSGLATLPHALLLFLSVEALVLRDRPIQGGLLLLGVALIRAEGVLWAGGVLMASALGGRRPWKAAGLLALGYAPYVAWKLSFYGAWTPNTAVAKVGLRPDALARGARYVAHSLLTLGGPMVALLGLPALLRERRGLALLALGGLAYPALAGGDFMPFARLLVAGLPFLALAAGLLARRRVAAVALVGLSLAGAATAWDVQLWPLSVRQALHFRVAGTRHASELEHWADEREQVRVLSRVGEAVASVTEPDDVVVAGAIGALGWTSRRPILDRHGLVTPSVARREVDQLYMPGHDKRVEIWHFLDQKPAVLFSRMLVSAELPQAALPYARDLAGRGLQSDYFPLLVPISEDRVVLMFRRVEGDPVQAWARWEPWL